MRIAYIISAYKYPQQLARLIHRLNSGSVHFFIHVDQKADIAVFFEMKQLLEGYQNVYFLERHVCYWGDFGHVEATLKGMREIARQGIHYDYVILLTGQCYPIKSIKQINEFLEKSKGLSYMSYSPVEGDRTKRIERWYIRLFSRFYFPFPNKYIPIPLKRFSVNQFKPYYWGSSYWCLHRVCVGYILDFLDKDVTKNESKFINFFRSIYIPDEFFFQTILLNSPLKKDIINDDLRYIQWPSGIYVPSPRILDRSDFVDLMASSKLFARKFDLNKDSQILDMIDAAVENQ